MYLVPFEAGQAKGVADAEADVEVELVGDADDVLFWKGALLVAKLDVCVELFVNGGTIVVVCMELLVIGVTVLVACIELFVAGGTVLVVWTELLMLDVTVLVAGVELFVAEVTVLVVGMELLVLDVTILVACEELLEVGDVALDELCDRAWYRLSLFGPPQNSVESPMQVIEHPVAAPAPERIELLQ